MVYISMLQITSLSLIPNGCCQMTNLPDIIKCQGQFKVYTLQYMSIDDFLMNGQLQDLMEK